MTMQRRIHAKQEGVLFKTNFHSNPVLPRPFSFNPIFTPFFLLTQPLNFCYSNPSHSLFHSALRSPTPFHSAELSFTHNFHSGKFTATDIKSMIFASCTYLYCVAMEKRGRRGVWGWSVCPIPPGVAPATLKSDKVAPAGDILQVAGDFNISHWARQFLFFFSDASEIKFSYTTSHDMEEFLTTVTKIFQIFTGLFPDWRLK